MINPIAAPIRTWYRITSYTLACQFGLCTGIDAPVPYGRAYGRAVVRLGAPYEVDCHHQVRQAKAIVRA